MRPLQSIGKRSMSRNPSTHVGTSLSFCRARMTLVNKPELCWFWSRPLSRMCFRHERKKRTRPRRGREMDHVLLNSPETTNDMITCRILRKGGGVYPRNCWTWKNAGCHTLCSFSEILQSFNSDSATIRWALGEKHNIFSLKPYRLDILSNHQFFSYIRNILKRIIKIHGGDLRSVCYWLPTPILLFPRVKMFNQPIFTALGLSDPESPYQHAFCNAFRPKWMRREKSAWARLLQHVISLDVAWYGGFRIWFLRKVKKDNEDMKTWKMKTRLIMKIDGEKE